MDKTATAAAETAVALPSSPPAAAQLSPLVLRPRGDVRQRAKPAAVAATTAAAAVDRQRRGHHEHDLWGELDRRALRTVGLVEAAATTTEEADAEAAATTAVVPPRGRIESVEGLVSIDRSVVAALLSTTPRA